MNELSPEPLTTRDARTILGLMTEDEFGRAVGVVGSTVALWRNKGLGPPFYRFKRNIFYRTADITQWIIENTWDPNTQTLIAPRYDPLALVNIAPAIPKSTRQQAVEDDESEEHAASAG